MRLDIKVETFKDAIEIMSCINSTSSNTNCHVLAIDPADCEGTASGSFKLEFDGDSGSFEYQVDGEMACLNVSDSAESIYVICNEGK